MSDQFESWLNEEPENGKPSKKPPEPKKSPVGKTKTKPEIEKPEKKKFGKPITELAEEQKFKAGFSGKYGTQKTGCGLNWRTAQQVKDGLKVIDLDFDKGSTRLRRFYNDPNIIIEQDLIVWDKSKKSMDLEATVEKVDEVTGWALDEALDGNVATIIIDGIDFFQTCLNMWLKRAILKIPAFQKPDYRWDWEPRNKKLYDNLLKLIGAPCNKLFVTHDQQVYDSKGNALDIWEPKWHAEFPNKLDQIFRFYKEERFTKNESGDVKKIIEYRVFVDKFGQAMESDGILGKTYTIKNANLYQLLMVDLRKVGIVI